MRSVGDEDYEDGVAVPGPMHRPVDTAEQDHTTELVETPDEVRCVHCDRAFPSFTARCPHDGADVVEVPGDR